MPDKPITCACLEGDFQPARMESTFLGTDDLYAEISVDACTGCGRNWLCYRLEYEHVRGSGRWYRGLIGPEVAFSHRNAAQILEQLSDYWAGGSHFSGKVQRRSGPIDVT